MSNNLTTFSNDLPANALANLTDEQIANLSDADLMRLSGQGVDLDGINLPSLRVNYDDEDADGHVIPRGQWTIVADGHGAVFAKSVDFRPIYATHQYSHYSKELNKMVSKSVHFQDFREEIPDSAGGFKCGKLSKKRAENLSPEEKLLQKEIRVARVVFGLVSLTGLNSKGDPVEVTNVPCVFYARGSNYMPIAEMLQDRKNSGLPMQRTLFTFNLEREKNDGVTYWSVRPVVKSDNLPTDANIIKLVRDFALTANAESASIFTKWKKARVKTGVETQAIAAAISGDDPDDGLGDILDPAANILSAG